MGAWECWKRRKGRLVLKRMESDHIRKQSGKSKINLAYFTVLPRAGLGACISTTQDDIFGDMF